MYIYVYIYVYVYVYVYIYICARILEFRVNFLVLISWRVNFLDVNFLEFQILFSLFHSSYK